MLERESLLRKARFRHYQSVKPKKHLVPTHKQKFLLLRAHGVCGLRRKQRRPNEQWQLPTPEERKPVANPSLNPLVKGMGCV